MLLLLITRAMILKISRRPISILIDKTNLPRSGSDEKLLMELTFPKPGPTLPIVVMDAEKAVKLSTFIPVRIKVVRKKVKT